MSAGREWLKGVGGDAGWVSWSNQQFVEHPHPTSPVKEEE